jgi:hypothetical protein
VSLVSDAASERAKGIGFELRANALDAEKAAFEQSQRKLRDSGKGTAWFYQ